ncbi:MAG TPA: hypothetical protein VFY29_20895 [Terriglobia bacterium]|nr:hypothetical protein [Terriglobia bacterium]
MAGNLFMVGGSRVRKVDLTGVISTVAGTGVAGFSGDGGSALLAQFGSQPSIDVDQTGNLFIADPANGRVRKVNTSGVIMTFAGGVFGTGGDGGPAGSAQLEFPSDVAFDAAGNLFIADGNGRNIRKVNPAGVISTVLSTGSVGALDLSVDAIGNLMYSSTALVLEAPKLPPPVPVVTSISLTAGTQGAIVPATITGSNLLGAVGVVFSGTGVTASIAGAPTDTSLPIAISIANTASTGLRAFTVSTPYSVSAGFSGFTIDQTSLPNALAMTPAAGRQGTTFAAAITGTGLAGATDVTFSGAGVTAAITAGGGDTVVPILMTIAPNATLGPRTVVIATPGGLTSVAFNVDPGIPNITSITTASGLQGSAIALTLNGTNLGGVTAVALSGAGVTAAITGPVTETSVPVTLTVAWDAQPGARTLKASTAYTTSPLFDGFTVQENPVPRVVFVMPVAALRGTTQNAVIGGYHLAGVTAVTFTGTGVTASILPGATDTRLPVSIQIAFDASTGTRNLTLTSPSGPSNAAAFTIATANAVQVTGISTSSAPVGVTTHLTISGKNLANTTGVTFSGAGMTAVVSGSVTDTSIPVDVTITAGAALGIRTLTVTTTSGNSDPFSGLLVRSAPRPSVIQTIAGGDASGFTGDGGPATAARLTFPAGVAIDGAGNVFIADSGNNRIRRVSADGIIVTVAGTGATAFGGDGGPAVLAPLKAPQGVAVDGLGNLYIADTGNNRIRKVNANGTITTIAGTATAGFSGDGGPASLAQLNVPIDLAIDRDGNLYITDQGNRRIRKIGVDGVMSTIAGTGTDGFSGDGGPATMAKLNRPMAVKVDATGNVFIADTNNHRVRKIDGSGVISTVAGTGVGDFGGDDGPATAAWLNRPRGLAFDPAGNLFIGDTDNARLRMVTPAGSITTVAGTGTAGFTGDGGQATMADISLGSIDVDGNGDVVLGGGLNRVRRVRFTVSPGQPVIHGISVFTAAQGGAVSATIEGENLNGATAVTFSGSGVTATIEDGGTATSLPVSIVVSPGAIVGVRALTVNAAGGVSDSFTGFNVTGTLEAPAITSISPSAGTIGTTRSVTIRGTGLTGATAVTFSGTGVTGAIESGGTADGLPVTVTVDVAAALGTRTFTVTTPGGVSAAFNGFTIVRPTITGITPALGMRGTSLAAAISGSNLSGATAITFSGTGVTAAIRPGATDTWLPITISIDASAALGIRSIVVTTVDATSSSFSGITIVAADPGGMITTIAGAGGSADSGDGGPAVLANLSASGVAVDDNGNVFVADAGNSRIRRIGLDGIIETVAGEHSGGNGAGDGGPATVAQLENAGRVAVDRVGNFYISGSDLGRVRIVTRAGIITSVAGTGFTNAFDGDGGAAPASALNFPRGIVLDPAGNLYIADSSNRRIRKVDTSGIISTIAGTGTAGFSGDGGPAVNAMLTFPSDIALDASGNLFVADSSDNRVRKIDSDGTITTVAGTGTSGFSGDGGPATSAKLSSPYGVAVDASGTLFIADFGNQRVRKVSPGGVISTVAGTGTAGFSGDGGPAVNALLRGPTAVAVDSLGNLYIGDNENRRVRKVTFPTTAAPVVASMSPRSADRGTAVSAVIHGNFLVGATGVTISGAGVTAVILPGGTNSDLPVTFTIDPASATGPRDVTVTSANGASVPVGIFTVSDSSDMPMITGITSAPGTVGTTISMTISGLALGSPVSVAFSGAGVAAAILSGGSGSSIPVSVTIASDATPGPRSITVTTAGGPSAPFDGFAVVTSAISTISPTYGLRGSTLTLTIAGSGLSNATAVAFSGTGVTGTINPGATDTSAVVSVTVAPDALLGTRLMTITSSGGTSAPVPFDVLVMLPTVTSITPSSGFVGTTATVTIVGTDFISGATSIVMRGSGFSGSGGVTVSNINVLSPTSLSASVEIAPDAVVGTRLTLLQTTGGIGLPISFKVLSAPPALAGISPSSGAIGSAVDVTLTGSNFDTSAVILLTGGAGISISNVHLVDSNTLTATFGVSLGAVVGSRNVRVFTTAGFSNTVTFSVFNPYPDASITMTHSGHFGAGFNEIYTVTVVNHGGVPSGPVTVTDILPAGLSFVSGAGTGWSCAAIGQTVTCNSAGMDVGAPGVIQLTVAVDKNAGPSVSNTATVATSGDPILTDNSALDATSIVPLSAPALTFVPSAPEPGQQGAVRLLLPEAFPHDLSGTLNLSFASTAAIPVNDPAIQFATGGRQISFSFPANSMEATFAGSNLAGPIGFQTGTVAGTLAFLGEVGGNGNSVAFGSSSTSSVVVAPLPPRIQNAQTMTQPDGFVTSISLLSTMREVTHLVLEFNTAPVARLSCGSLPGCVVSGSTITLDVRGLFDAWYAGDAVSGSQSVLRLPFSIQGGTLHGSIIIKLRNSLGISNAISVAIP